MNCDNCYYAHANCEDKGYACDMEEMPPSGTCDDYMGVSKIRDAERERTIHKVLEIIDRNSSVISDKTALKWIRAEVQALQEEQG